jgi:hypothetical protein
MFCFKSELFNCNWLSLKWLFFPLLISFCFGSSLPPPWNILMLGIWQQSLLLEGELSGFRPLDLLPCLKNIRVGTFAKGTEKRWPWSPDRGKLQHWRSLLWLRSWMYPKGLFVRVLVPRMVLLGTGETFQSWGLVKGSRSLGVFTLEGDCGTPAPSSPSLLPG